MNILTTWLRSYLPTLPVDDRQLADDLTLRGIAVEGVHPLASGHLFEMDITTNRVDAMNHYGIAREAATIYNLPLTPLVKDSTLTNESSSRPDPERAKRVEGGAEKSASLPKPLHSVISTGALSEQEASRTGVAEKPASLPQTSNQPAFPIRIEANAKQLCGRFTAQVLRNITIAPSTGKIAEYFTLLNQKQISNAVDASNFVLLGMGHPTHAFDLDKLEGGIVVRLAHKGEKLKLLDGTDRILEADDLVVADEKKALALAGVMGGWDSMITPETKNILVEAAWFDQASIRRSSRRHGLHTDASHRFERGADFNAAPIANKLVAQLILANGGYAEGELIDVVIPEIAVRTASRPAIELSVKQVQRHLGTTIAPEGITKEIVAQYLTALGCKLNPATNPGAPSFASFAKGGVSSEARPSSSTPDTTFQVQLPSWRLDLEREIDLIEEVARVYGYNRFANTLPTPLPVIAHPTAAKEAAVRTRLLALGFSESISSTFASHQDADLFAQKEKGTIPMENPLSEEASLLRPTLIPGMVTMLSHNLNRDVKEVRLFEQGQIFTGTTNQVNETAQLTLGLTTANPQTIPPHMPQDAPFFELKGAIESLLGLFDLSSRPERSEVEGPAVVFTTKAPQWLQSGRAATAVLNNQPIAHFGELSAPETQKRKLRQPIYLAQLDLARLYDLPLKKITARDLSRFQAVERDFSFVFPDAVQWQTVASAIHALAIPELQSLKPAEVWRDPKKYPGVYSLLVRAIFQSNDRTLREEELTTWWSTIIATLTSLGGTIRA
jgi:phenylalanyl-tRNA synthetase beta chain